MKLHQYKAMYITQLSLLTPVNDKEKELRSTLINKLYNLRTMTLPDLSFLLYRIIEYENVSKNFKDLCRYMLEDIRNIDELYQEK